MKNIIIHVEDRDIGYFKYTFKHYKTLNNNTFAIANTYLNKGKFEEYLNMIRFFDMVDDLIYGEGV